MKRNLAVCVFLAIVLLAGIFIYKARRQSFFGPGGGVVSLLPSTTEILFELGQNNITGVGTFCNWPPQTENIQKLGDSFSADVEAIYALRPARVYITASEFDLKTRLENLNIPAVAIADARSIEDTYNNIEFIAAVEGLDAAPLINELKKYAVSKPDKKIKAFIELDNGLWTTGGQSFINDLIEYAGAENIFKNTDAAYFQAPLEAILSQKPAIIISIKPRHLEGDYLPPELKKLKIIRLNPDIYARPAPRAIRSIPALKGMLNENL